MICPKCGGTQTYCTDSRQRGATRWRRYKCPACGAGFETSEGVRMTPEESRQGQCSTCLVLQEATLKCRVCPLARAADAWAQLAKAAEAWAQRQGEELKT